MLNKKIANIYNVIHVLRMHTCTICTIYKSYMPLLLSKSFINDFFYLKDSLIFFFNMVKFILKNILIFILKIKSKSTL